MTYTKENLPDEFTAINSADTLITVKRVTHNVFFLSSAHYPKDYEYSEERVLSAVNKGTWEIKKVILIKQSDYEIF